VKIRAKSVTGVTRGTIGEAVSFEFRDGVYLLCVAWYGRPGFAHVPIHEVEDAQPPCCTTSSSSDFSLFILACIVVLCKIKPEDARDAKRRLPQDLQEAKERTHFYEAVKPGQALPPVPGRHREPQTTIMPAIQGQAGRTDTAYIPAIRP
jgi:hypothetical protein